MGSLNDTPARCDEFPSLSKTFVPTESTIKNPEEIKQHYETGITMVKNLLENQLENAIEFPTSIVFKALIKLVEYTINDGLNKSVKPFREVLKQEIKEEVLRSKMVTLKSYINSLESRVNDLNDQTNAIVAVDTCEKALTEFDEDTNLWKACVLASSLLVPFSGICIKVLEECARRGYTQPENNSKLKTQLLTVLTDYKKQTILTRLNFVEVEVSYFNIWVDSDPYETYTLNHAKFSDPNGEWTRDSEFKTTFLCTDKWINCRVRKSAYADVFQYRRRLSSLYGDDYDKMIKLAEQKLAFIPGGYASKKREYCQAKSSWGAVPR